MPVNTRELNIPTRGNGQVVDITPMVAALIRDNPADSGIAAVFAPGATAGITTIEYESGAVQDLQEAIERLAPEKMNYHHNSRWHDGNGHSHVRAALVGPGLTVPFTDKKLMLGTWQQIVLIDFDNHSRNRRIIVQIVGD
ncbi:YjbQ family protein [bacterium]|nr:YjbQ family protein [candidate division CSSED10-310 bacterium]